MKKIIGAVVSSALMLGSHSAVQATEYPSSPIRLIVPFAPGGNVDLTARIISDKLGQRLGQPVVVENRPGAGGSLGASLVAKAKPDGYTLLMGASGPLSINPIAIPKLSYDAEKSFTAIAQIHYVPLAVLVPSDSKMNSITDLIGAAAQNPEKISSGSAGLGTMNHMALELFNQKAKVKLLHVPYRGGGPALTALMGKEIDVAFEQLNSSISFIRDGRLRPLAVTTTKRLPSLPGIPTLNELGLTDYYAATFVGVLAPSGTPESVISRLNKAIQEVVGMPEIRQRLMDMGAEPTTGPPAEFEVLVKTELRKWATLADQAKIVFQ